MHTSLNKNVIGSGAVALVTWSGKTAGLERFGRRRSGQVDIKQLPAQMPAKARDATMASVLTFAERRVGSAQRMVAECISLWDPDGVLESLRSAAMQNVDA
jgi:hypothetical protein